MEKIIIFGAGDIARLAHFYFENDSNYQVVAFSVDDSYKNAESFQELPLISLSKLVEMYSPGTYKIFAALSYVKMNKIRSEKYYLLKKMGYEFVNYISSKATILNNQNFGENCFILENNTIQPFVKIGNNVTLWSGNHIGHDSIIEDHVFIASHVVVSGFVKVKSYSFIGVNATIRNSITIEKECLIGAGSIIMENTVEQGVYLPERAKLISKKSFEIDL
jgi:sugar O-acyltransferase (sialic acid O-acetyltransferase NeuD family)